jgi:phospholipase C
VGLLVYYVARRTRQDFEGKFGPEDCRPGHCPPVTYREPPPAVLGFPLRRQEQLSDPSFWARWRQSTRLLRIHMAAGAALLGGLTYWAFRKSNFQAVHNVAPEGFHLRPWFVWLARVQMGLMLLLLALFLVGWGWRRAKGFRWAAPVAVSLMSIAISNGFFAGLTAWVGQRTKQPPTVDFDQRWAFGVGSLAFVGSLVAWMWWHWHGRRREMDRLRKDRNAPPNSAPPGTEQDGITEPTRRQVALTRSFARSIRHIDLVFTVSGAAFLIASIIAVFRVDVPCCDWLAPFGGWVVVTLVGIALPLLFLQAIRQPDRRAQLKIIWDAITFWPRRFHPLAVRPYAERSVPELQGWLYDTIVRRKRRAVIAAHSQGSILAYCALLHLARWRRQGGDDVPEITRDVALVTFGCPLRDMHAHYFPAYFRYPDDFEILRESLFQGDSDCLAWKNFYHLTDYVGRSLFHHSDDLKSKHRECDEEIPDPPIEPRRVGLAVRWPATLPDDPPLPPFTKLAVHSYYNNAIQLRAWVDHKLEPILRHAGETRSPRSGIPPGEARRAGSASPGRIEHVVIMCKENKTYDQYFGRFPGGDGDPNLKRGKDPPKPYRLPYLLQRIPQRPFPTHGHWSWRHRSWLSPRQQYTEEDIPIYWAYARSYTLCDRYFTDVAGPSTPNHLMLAAAETGGLLNNPRPAWVRIFTGSETQPPYDVSSLPEMLDEKGLSWGNYGCEAMPHLSYVRRNATHNFPSERFVEDAAAGDLPTVTWLDAPVGSQDSLIATGMRWSAAQVDAIVQGGLWDRTVIFIVWDDWGGWHDHVQPPRLENWPRDGSQFRYGSRVPCLVLSPFARAGYISKDLHSHASIVRFCEDILDLPHLNARTAGATGMSDCFDFDQAPLPPPPPTASHDRTPSEVRNAARRRPRRGHLIAD